jgi:CRP-like cAMP-binding protein
MTLVTRSARDFFELLAAGRWFRSISPAFQQALLGPATVRQLAAGTQLFARGDPPDGLYAVLEGGVRIAGIGESGKEAVLAVMEPPQWFGEIAVFDGEPRTHDATAVVDSRVLHVPSAAMSAILTANPAWWRELALLVTAKLRLAFLMIEGTALLPLGARIAGRLVLMAEGEWADRSQRVVKLRQEVLAAMVSASRQSTNQVLKELESRGLIKVAYGELEVIDLEGLRLLASGR